MHIIVPHYAAGIGLTQNFELKILSLTYMPDQLVHYNLWYTLYG